MSILPHDSTLITSEIFTAFQKCHLKAYNLFKKIPEEPHAYTELIEKHRHILKDRYAQNNRRASLFFDQNLIYENLKAKGYFLLETKTNNSDWVDKKYTPIMFLGTLKVDNISKLSLAFTALIISKKYAAEVPSGRIVCLNGREQRVNFNVLYPKVVSAITDIKNLIIKGKKRPELILSKGCQTCQFQAKCKKRALNTDHLSLLDGISTQKQLQKYQKKGIFTVNQLSYLYRPRRQKKRSRKSITPKHSVELQALVLRLGKIYIHSPPNIARKPIEIFLDIENLPDHDFYYLIGTLVQHRNQENFHSFWANKPKDEKEIWKRLRTILDTQPDSPIYHYGDFERKAIQNFGQRYKTDVSCYVNRLVNVNTFIFGKIYFPTVSNSLKTIGKYIGCKWTAENSDGLSSILWRSYWDEKQKGSYRKKIVQYNKEDCLALKELVNFLTIIEEKKDSVLDVDCFVHTKKPRDSKVSNPLHSQLESILKYAHAGYAENKISLSQDYSIICKNKKSRKRPQQRNRRRITKFIRITNTQSCPKCSGEKVRVTEKTRERIEVGFDFSRNGIRKNVIKYWAYVSICEECRRQVAPEKFRGIGRPSESTYEYKAFITYLRVGLRLSYGNIKQVLQDLFNETLCDKLIMLHIQQMAQRYKDFEKLIISSLIKSDFLCVDETMINVNHVNQYVWIITNKKYAIYQKTETREAFFIQDLLADFKGVLITDFYAGFDKINCTQQKCLVHIIKELNNDLWTTPFDTEFSRFVKKIKELIVPILETIQKFGSKKIKLQKFNKKVDLFYEEHIVNRSYRSDMCIKYQKRFTKYWKKLFTFLNHDKVPWHNNAAENALRQITMQQDVSKVFSDSNIHSYLLLLSVKQTCKYNQKPFLDFLLSGKRFFE